MTWRRNRWIHLAAQAYPRADELDLDDALAIHPTATSRPLRHDLDRHHRAGLDTAGTAFGNSSAAT